MQKLIALSIALSMFVLPSFAGNLLQQQDEIKFVQKFADNPMPTYYGKDYLIREDYYGYWNGKDSLYGVIINTLEDISKSDIANKDLNIKYLNLMKSKIDTIVKIQNSDIDNRMRENTLYKPIFVDDNDYRQLAELTKECIQMYNFIFSGN